MYTSPPPPVEVFFPGGRYGLCRDAVRRPDSKNLDTGDGVTQTDDESFRNKIPYGRIFFRGNGEKDESHWFVRTYGKPVRSALGAMLAAR